MFSRNKKYMLMGGLMLLWLFLCPGLAAAQADISISISDPDIPAGAGQQEGNTIYSVLSSPQVTFGEDRELGTVRAIGKPGVAIPVPQGKKVKITLPPGTSYMQVPNADNYRNYVEWPASVNGQANQIADQGEKPGMSFVSGSPRSLTLKVENLNSSAPVMTLDFVFNKAGYSTVRVSPVLDYAVNYFMDGDANITRLEFFKMLVDSNLPFSSSPLLNMGSQEGWESRFTDLKSLSAADLGKIRPLLETGLVSGYPGGKLAADQPISRAEAASLAGKIYNFSGKKAAFTDSIPAWAAAGIDSAVSGGIVAGYPDGSFHPECMLNKAEGLFIAQNCLESYSHK